MRGRLSKPRYRHALCVARTGEKLARKHGGSRAAARIAGVLHDVAREWSPKKLLEYAREHGLPVSDLELASPLLLHARVGADVAQREFGVTDPDVLAAIATHTVAEPRMSELQKIMFVADTVEPTRTYVGREALEAAALRALDEGLLGCVKASMEYLLARGVPVAPQTLEVYNALVTRYGTTA
jgi:predicted HD superfamily hydrolase involved in NAD metabolism